MDETQVLDCLNHLYEAGCDLMAVIESDEQIYAGMEAQEFMSKLIEAWEVLGNYRKVDNE